MNYKDCLILTTFLFWPNNKFDCEAFAKYLFGYRLYRIATDKYYHTLQEMTKRTSNDLDRLYKMGFLRRKRVKRIAITRSEMVNRGFKYEYSVSDQGWQYFLYLMRQVSAPQDERLPWERNTNLELTGDPVLDIWFKKEVTLARISPRTLALVNEYVELTRRTGGRYNRFRSSRYVDKKLLIIVILCADTLQDKFDALLTKADTMMAALKHLSREEDIHRSRIIEAARSSKANYNKITALIEALADRARRFMQSGAGQYNQQQRLQLPVSSKHPYVILEVDEMLQRVARQQKI